jgi:hypothetical protein
VVSHGANTVEGASEGKIEGEGGAAAEVEDAGAGGVAVEVVRISCEPLGPVLCGGSPVSACAAHRTPVHMSDCSIRLSGRQGADAPATHLDHCLHTLRLILVPLGPFALRSTAAIRDTSK